MANSPSGESMVDRLGRILEAFDSTTISLSVSELARRANLPTSTAYRLTDELVAAGILEKVDREVRIGLRLWELTTRSSSVLHLRELARPVLDEVRRTLQCHALLGVLDRHDVLYVDRALAESAAVNLATVAGRMPCNACSAGLVLMAHQSPAAQENWLGSRFARHTEATPTDPAVLRRRLAIVRQQGHAEAVDLIVDGSSGIAVPVEGPGRSVVAALAIVVPTQENQVNRALPVLHRAARELSKALTSPPGSPVPRH